MLDFLELIIQLMSLDSMGDTFEGIALIGAPWSGKTTIGKLLVPSLDGWKFHDMDDDGLQNQDIGWGNDGVAKKLVSLGDERFLEAEGKFVQDNYGTSKEGKYFSFEKTCFSSTGSLPLSPEAMKYVQERTHVVLIDVPIPVLVERSKKGRPDGNTRIVGMNGESPKFRTLEDTLTYRGEIYKKVANTVIPYIDTEPPIETARRVMHVIYNTQPR